MKKAALVALSLLATSGAACAADMYSSGSLKDAPMPVVGPTWTGIIAGIGAAGVFVNHDIGVNIGGTRVADINGLSGVGPGVDFLLGLRYQFPGSRFVVGVEGEYAITDATFNVSVPLAGINTSLDQTGNWSVAGTAGYLINQWTLAYVGAGWGEAFYHPTGILANVLTDKTIDGAVLKAGIEAKFTQNFSVRAQYEYFAANETTLWSAPRNLASITDTANSNSVKLIGIYQFGSIYEPLK